MSVDADHFTRPAYLCFMSMICVGWVLICAIGAMGYPRTGWNEFRRDEKQSCLKG